MTFNDAGMALLKEFEGCSLKSYQDQGGTWTIGYGSTRNVVEGMTITSEIALNRLQTDVTNTEAMVKALIPVELTDNQYSAFVCFAFNVRGWTVCPLTQHLRRGDLEEAKSRWLLYNKVNGVHSDGLLRRRQAELALFLS